MVVRQKKSMTYGDCGLRSIVFQKKSERERGPFEEGYGGSESEGEERDKMENSVGLGFDRLPWGGGRDGNAARCGEKKKTRELEWETERPLD